MIRWKSHSYLTFAALLPVFACMASVPARAQKPTSQLLSSGWQMQGDGPGTSHPIAVPGTWRTAGAVPPALGVYSRTIQVPASAAGQAVWLEFEGVNGASIVSVGPNMSHLRPMAEHASSLRPFAINITSLVTPGEKAVVRVGVRATGAALQLPGIVRPVRLRIVPQNYVDVRDIEVRREASAARSVSVAAEVMNLSNTAQKAVVKAEFAQGVSAPIAAQTVDLKPGEVRRIQFGTVKWLASPQTDWRPNTPYRADYKPFLHAVTVSTHATALTRQFGYSSVRSTQAGLFAGSTHLRLRADVLDETRHGSPVFATANAFSMAGWPDTIRAYQQLNINALCFQGMPATREMLEACDKAGMLVIQPAGIESGPEHLAACRADASHPALVMWISGGTAAADTTQICKEADPTVPLLSAGAASGSIKLTGIEAGTLEAMGGAAEIQAAAMADVPESPAFALTSIRIQRASQSPILLVKGLTQAAPGAIASLAPAAAIQQPGKPLPPEPIRISSSGLSALRKALAGVAAFDLEYCRSNVHSNGRGDWPTSVPTQMGGTTVQRHFTVVNDDSAGSDLRVIVLPTIRNSPTDVQALPEFSATVHAAPGSTAEVTMPLLAPVVAHATELSLQVTVWKAGKERFRETLTFVIMPRSGVRASVKYLGLDTSTHGDWVNSEGKRVYGQQAFFIAIRGGRTLYQDPDLYLRRVPAIEPEDRYRGDVHDDSADSEIEFQRTETTLDPRVLWTAPDRLVKHPVAFYGSNGKLFFRADCVDGATHLLSLYILDFARPGVSFDVELFDSQAHLLESRRIDGKSLDEGAYVRYQIEGSVYISIVSLSKYLPAVSGLFLDPVANGQKSTVSTNR